MSGQTANLVNDTILVDEGKDALVVVKDLADVPGGATLDCSDSSLDDLSVIKAGHLIVKDASTSKLKPLAISNGAYGSIGSDTAVGVLKKSILKSKPFAAICTMGQVNKSVCPYTVTSTLVSAFPHIQFI